MIKHTYPDLKDKTLRGLMAADIYAAWRVAHQNHSDVVFCGYLYGMSQAYERVQRLLKDETLVWTVGDAEV